MKEKFKKIAVFQYSSEAQIIRSRLEADGVEVFLFDQFTIDTDLLASNALGGIKLNVWAEDEKKDLGILKSISDYSLDEHGMEMECPNCEIAKIEQITTIRGIKSFFSFLLSFISVSLPINITREYRCETCKQKFKLE